MSFNIKDYIIYIVLLFQRYSLGSCTERSEQLMDTTPRVHRRWNRPGSGSAQSVWGSPVGVGSVKGEGECLLV